MSKRSRKQDAATAVLPNMNKREIPTDVLGSYTGVTTDWEAPVQDADDL